MGNSCSLEAVSNILYVAVLPGENQERLLQYYQKQVGCGTESGLDLPLPEDLLPTEKGSTNRVGLGVVCQMVHQPTGTPIAWSLVPRSSISKTPYRLANSIGIMDQTYTGEVQMALDTYRDTQETLEAGTRLVQAVSGNLLPPIVKLCSVEDIRARAALWNPQSVRGSGGFGSTGTTI